MYLLKSEVLHGCLQTFFLPWVRGEINARVLRRTSHSCLSLFLLQDRLSPASVEVLPSGSWDCRFGQ